jgi:hypothetical protein
MLEMHNTNTLKEQKHDLIVLVLFRQCVGVSVQLVQYALECMVEKMKWEIPFDEKYGFNLMYSVPPSVYIYGFDFKGKFFFNSDMKLSKNWNNITFFL